MASEPIQPEVELSPDAKRTAESFARVLAGSIIQMANALAGDIVCAARKKAADKIADDSGD